MRRYRRAARQLGPFVRFAASLGSATLSVVLSVPGRHCVVDGWTFAGARFGAVRRDGRADRRGGKAREVGTKMVMWRRVSKAWGHVPYVICEIWGPDPYGTKEVWGPDPYGKNAA